MTRPKVLAYYFPDWHEDARNAGWFGPGWTEWKLIREATGRFDGHRQPRIPSLGYFDEADPAVAATQIDLARSHGVDGFLVDYYWYDDGPYLERALDEGLLKAPNADDIEFALMWANHELLDIFPLDTATTEPRRLKSGAIDRAAFESFVHHILDNYLSRPNYLKIDGKPWLTIYEIGSFIRGLGGVDEAADALGWFRDEAARRGLPGLHLDAVVWGFGVLPTAVTVTEPAELIAKLGFDSASSYVWIHHVDVENHPFPVADVGRMQDEAFAEYKKYATELPVPFYPNVSVGWDTTPRTKPTIPYRPARYAMPIWDQTPAEFERGLRRAAEFLDEHRPPHPILTVNAWNEWSEGSSLLPDTVNGLAFLEAIRRVFGALHAR